MTHPSDYTATLDAALDRLHDEGRYRTFIDIERRRGHYPHAIWTGPDGTERPITVWCGNDYLGMGQHPVVLEAMHEAESKLVTRLRRELVAMNDVTLFGPEDSAGIVSFAIDDIHPHDLGTILDESNVAIRAGHHCTQPVMQRYGVPATGRASFSIYNTKEDADQLVAAILKVQEVFA